MVPATWLRTAPVPPPSSHRALAQQPPARPVTALALVTTRHLLDLCRLAVQAAHRRCPPPLPTGPGGARRTSSEASLLLLALLRTLWRRAYAARRAWLRAWPALALACGLPTGPDGQPRAPRPRQQGKRAAAGGAPPCAMRLVLAVREARRARLIGARDLISASAPILAWRRRDPDAASGHAPAHHPTAFLRGSRAQTLLCRGSGLPLVCIVAPANYHDRPCARPLLTWAVRLYGLRPRRSRRDAASWGLARSHGIHATLGAGAVIPWHPKRQQHRDRLPPTWTLAERGQRGGIARFCGRVCRCFGLQRPPVVGWTAVVQRVARTDTAAIVAALVAHRAGRPDRIRAPKRVLAHLWEGDR